MSMIFSFKWTKHAGHDNNYKSFLHLQQNCTEQIPIFVVVVFAGFFFSLSYKLLVWAWIKAESQKPSTQIFVFILSFILSLFEILHVHISSII